MAWLYSRLQDMLRTNHWEGKVGEIFTLLVLLIAAILVILVHLPILRVGCFHHSKQLIWGKFSFKEEAPWSTPCSRRLHWDDSVKRTCHKDRVSGDLFFGHLVKVAALRVDVLGPRLAEELHLLLLAASDRSSLGEVKGQLPEGFRLSTRAFHWKFTFAPSVQ